MAYTLAEAIRIAREQEGYREKRNSYGSNLTKYNDWLGTISGYPNGGRSYPWCASVQSWIDDRAGGTANVDYPRTASCWVATEWFKKAGSWSSTPRVGAWCFYGTQHVERVIGIVDSRTVLTAGGNTSGSFNGNWSNGDGFYIKQVSTSRITGYGMPLYDDVTVPSGGALPRPAAPRGLVEDGQLGTLTATATQRDLNVDDDGVWGKVTVRALQKRVGAKEDGILGRETTKKVQKRVGAQVDGIWPSIRSVSSSGIVAFNTHLYSKTTEKLQKALNEGKF